MSCLTTTTTTTTYGIRKMTWFRLPAGQLQFFPSKAATPAPGLSDPPTQKVEGLSTRCRADTKPTAHFYLTLSSGRFLQCSTNEHARIAFSVVRVLSGSCDNSTGDRSGENIANGTICLCTYEHTQTCKGGAILVEVWAGSEGSRRLRWQGCQPYTPAEFTPQEIFLVI